MHIESSSSSSSGQGPRTRAGLSRSLTQSVPIDCAELAERLRAIAKLGGDAPPVIPEQHIELAGVWLESLLERMDAMSALSADELAGLKGLKDQAGNATKLAVASRSKLGRTSLAAASVMYWLSFGPGKIATNTVAAALILAGLPQAASNAPWTNVLLVPFIQVLFAEPVGGAYRADGQSYASPDGVAYVNYQTAHALMIRAWIENKPAEVDKYRGIMGRIVDDVIDRENKPDSEGHARMSQVSGASKPARNQKGIAIDPATDPARSVMSQARWRAFLTDEVPVHTFSLLNGVSGGLSLLWPSLMGAAWARVPDAALHVLLGTVAMVWMFEGQNSLRRDLQAASVQHGSDKEILDLKRAEPEQRLQLWTARRQEAEAALAELRELRSSLKALLKKAAANDPAREQAQVQLNRLESTVRELRQRVSDMRRQQRRAQRATQAWASSRDRAQAAVNRTLSSYVGEHDKQPVKWLDGSPVIVRNLSKLFGYMAVLAPSAAQTMLLMQMLSPTTAPPATGFVPGFNGTVPQPMGWNTTQGQGNPTDDYVIGVGLTQIAMASTVALNAIVGWTGRSLYAVPAFEHLMHGVIGVANRIGDEASALCGVTRPTPPADDIVVAVDTHKL